MSFAVSMAVLLAALLHASWNAMIKGGGDVLHDTAGIAVLGEMPAPVAWAGMLLISGGVFLLGYRALGHAPSRAAVGFALALADRGWREALRRDPHLKAGLNVAAGKVTYREVADALGLAYTAADAVIG